MAYSIASHISFQHNAVQTTAKSNTKRTCPATKTGFGSSRPASSFVNPSKVSLKQSKVSVRTSFNDMENELATGEFTVDIPPEMLEALQGAMSRAKEADEVNWVAARQKADAQLAAAKARREGGAPVPQQTQPAEEQQCLGLECDVSSFWGDEPTAPTPDHVLHPRGQVHQGSPLHVGQQYPGEVVSAFPTSDGSVMSQSASSYAMELLQAAKQAAIKNYHSQLKQKKELDECIVRSQRSLKVLDQAMVKVDQEQAYYEGVKKLLSK
mmetsp:Transcript_19554/g.27073  ORF Transcript_19554/g.27073 Transcript_19554/m.27073 type:complete len:267 (+) Transcript_19554:250-1050(+)|eukprot:CAMPEP_0196583472 /NCGR_PEP_ID=MMETSP1081-20130531/43782_1 /TAXON_ID=36882 /ORGANISM="Pyramimonas amylifera, Strain CCMP720" /LENGTH=266 /DNA_ID=CAMNT_0041904381 /DNA_START=250 /DNA_END=1050 /DNA_ORIENTATION=-